MKVGVVRIFDKAWDRAANWYPLRGKELKRAIRKAKKETPLLLALNIIRRFERHDPIPCIKYAQQQRANLLREMDITESDIIYEEQKQDCEGNWDLMIKAE